MKTLRLTPEEQWAEEQFGTCQFFDQRRTHRLVGMAIDVARKPAGTFPEIFESWNDTKAGYNLFDNPSVTRQRIIEPHCLQTRAAATGRCLILADLTEIDFGRFRQIDGAFPTGNGTGNGFLLHSALMIRPQTKELIGLAGQTVHYRKPHRKDRSVSDRLQRHRESEVWGEVIDQIGAPPEGAVWTHVMDRGADNFEVFCHARQQNTEVLVRVSHKNRKIICPNGEIQPLSGYLQGLPVAGTREQEVPARHRRPARTAHMEIRFGKLRIPPPVHRSPYLKKLKPGPISMSCVWAYEVNPPSPKERLEWILYAMRPVEDFSTACERLDDYTNRWLIEEWHKGLKSGCRVEERQLKTAERLENMVGLMSVEAVRLLQVKSIARTDPNRPAQRVVPSLWIEMLCRVRHLRHRARLTVGAFYRELAKLGGFLGRKCDGEPGWITIWRGWEKLHLMLRGAGAFGIHVKENNKTCG